MTVYQQSTWHCDQGGRGDMCVASSTTTCNPRGTATNRSTFFMLVSTHLGLTRLTPSQSCAKLVWCGHIVAEGMPGCSC